MNDKNMGQTAKSIRGELTSFYVEQEEDTALVFDFFIVFSRFEYALKRAQFFRNNLYANADWKKFADENNVSFNIANKESIIKSINYLMENPTKKQIVEGGNSLGWGELDFPDDETELWKLLKIVKTTRNNLFHGGKYYPVPVDEPARNKTLLTHCFNILSVCLELDDDIKGFYNEKT